MYLRHSDGRVDELLRMRALLEENCDVGLLIVYYEACIGLLKKLRRHLPRRKRFVPLRILRYRTEDTLRESRHNQNLM